MSLVNRPRMNASPALCSALVPMSKLWLVCDDGARAALCNVADIDPAESAQWRGEPWVCIPPDKQARLLSVFGIDTRVARASVAAGSPVSGVAAAGGAHAQSR